MLISMTPNTIIIITIETEKSANGVTENIELDGRPLRKGKPLGISPSWLESRNIPGQEGWGKGGQEDGGKATNEYVGAERHGDK